MNKSLYIIIIGIVVVGGLIGYTMFGKSSSESHTAGDDYTDAEHQDGNVAPHDDTGTTPHTD